MSRGFGGKVIISAVIEVILDEMREIVETDWPELSHKLPPKPGGLRR